jgi:hypothetical protein
LAAPAFVAFDARLVVPLAARLVPLLARELPAREPPFLSACEPLAREPPLLAREEPLLLLRALLAAERLLAPRLAACARPPLAPLPLPLLEADFELC